MSDPRIAALSESLGGAPEDLVERSAAARAQAQGVSVDEVLSAWAGGQGVVSQAAPPPPADVAPATEADEVEPPSEPLTTADPAPSPVVVAAAPTEPDHEEEEPVEPAGLGERLRIGAKVGALVGSLLGVVAVLVVMPMVLSRLTIPSGESTPAVEVTALATVLTIAVLSAAFGVIVTLVSRGAASFVSPAFDTESSPRSSIILGGFMGLVLGFIGGGIVIGTAEATLTTTKLLPVRSLLFTLIVGGIALGAITGASAQGLAQPARLRGEAAAEAAVVKRRLGDSLMIPAVSALIILVIVVSLGSLLVRYPSYAPLLAILVAFGVLAFASLMASRPNLRVSRGEVLVAAAGVGVVLLMLALIAAQTSDGGHGNEGEDANVAAVVW